MTNLKLRGSATAQVREKDSILVPFKSRIFAYKLEISFYLKATSIFNFFFVETCCLWPLDRHNLSPIYILFSVTSDKTPVESFSLSSHTLQSCHFYSYISLIIIICYVCITLEGSISVLIQHILKNGEPVIIYLK